MKHISLFSGIGGFDLAAQWAGWTNIASCEINPFGRRVLSHYWPDAYHHDDIKTLTGEIIEYETQKRYGPNWRADGVILSGGFPCQPYSLAGKRLGKEDERHLWPQMLRVIREVKPDWIVGENVFGLVNWSDGLVFHEVQTDLENEGYEVQAFVLPACATDAPHRRDRLWIVAYNKGSGVKPEINEREKCINKNREEVRYMYYTDGYKRTTTNAMRERGGKGGSERQPKLVNKNGEKWPAFANANGNGQQQQSPLKELEGRRPGVQSICNDGADWHNFPTQSPVCPRNDGISAGLDGITFPKWRNESIKAAGNAVVPQLVFRIFDTINKYNSL